MAKRRKSNGTDPDNLNPPDDYQHAVTLSATELEERRRRLPALVADLEETEEGFVEAKGKWNRKIKGLRGEIARVAKAITTGTELQDHPELPMGG
jgi:hypothetical protein